MSWFNCSNQSSRPITQSQKGRKCLGPEDISQAILCSSGSKPIRSPQSDWILSFEVPEKERNDGYCFRSAGPTMRRQILSEQRVMLGRCLEDATDIIERRV